jgi:hypothetical protein
MSTMTELLRISAALEAVESTVASQLPVNVAEAQRALDQLVQKARLPVALKIGTDLTEVEVPETLVTLFKQIFIAQRWERGVWCKIEWSFVNASGDANPANVYPIGAVWWDKDNARWCWKMNDTQQFGYV